MPVAPAEAASADQRAIADTQAMAPGLLAASGTRLSMFARLALPALI